MQVAVARVQAGPAACTLASGRSAASNRPAAARRARHLALRSPERPRPLATRAVAEENGVATSVPEPVVKIDNQHDPFSTIVTVEFGDRLGELTDTVAALRGLGLNIRRAKLSTKDCGGQKHKFFITDARTSEKVVKSAKLEEVRLTILNNMLKYHPESAEQLAWGGEPARAARVRTVDPTSPLGARRRTGGFATQIETREAENGLYTELYINTLDRPGLLTDIVHVLKDISLNVVSAEVDTIGRHAVDKFNLTYHGEPLPDPMCQLAVNALQYYLSQGEVEKEWEESY